MNKYANISIDANRDMFWKGVENSYKNLRNLALFMGALSLAINFFVS
ncbi:MAG: hypothetical protein ACRCWQ_01955 [Bacilli bacterium]